MRIIKFIIFVLIVGSLLYIWPKIFGKNLDPTGSISYVDYCNNFDLRQGRKFNHISPCSYEANTIEDTIGNLRTIYDGYDIHGTYIYECTLRIQKASDTQGLNLISELLTISVNINYYSKIEDITYAFGDNIFYRFVISEELQDEYVPFEGFDLCNIYGEEVTATIAYVDTYTTGINKAARNIANRCNYYLKINMMFISYTLVTNDNTINIDCNNPATEAEIVGTIGFTLPNGTVLSNYEVIGSNYNSNEVYAKNYIISVRALDSDNKIYVKNIIVNASEYNPIRNNTIMTTYYNRQTRDNLIQALGIECGYKYIEFNTDYTDNYNICGEYSFSIKIITNDNDIYKRTGKIIVYDNVGPVIMGNKDLYTDTEHRLSYKEILSNYTAVDEYSNTGIVLDVIEKNAPDNLYINNYNKADNYNMNIEASDQYGNVSTLPIVLHVSQYQHYEPVVTSSSREVSSSSSSSSSSSTSIPSSSSSSSSTSAPSSNSQSFPGISTSYIPEISSSSENIPSSSALPSTTSSSEITSSSSNIPSSSATPSTSVWVPVIIDEPSTTTTTPTIAPSTTTSVETSTSSNTIPSTSAWIPIEFGTSSSNIAPSTTSTTEKPKESSSTTPQTTTWIPIEFGTSSKPTTTTTTTPSTTTMIEPSRTSTETSRTSVWMPVDLGTSTTQAQNPTTNPTTNEEPSVIPSTRVEESSTIPTTEISVEESTIPSTEITTEPTNPIDNSSKISQTISSTSKSYIISTDTNTTLTIEDIKRKLLNIGLISEEEYSSVVIESNYFEKAGSEGYYIINIKHSDGSVDTCAIKVQAAEVDSSNNNMIIIFSIIGSVSIILFASIIIFLVRKRGKNNEKAN